MKNFLHAKSCCSTGIRPKKKINVWKKEPTQKNRIIFFSYRNFFSLHRQSAMLKINQAWPKESRQNLVKIFYLYNVKIVMIVGGGGLCPGSVWVFVLKYPGAGGKLVYLYIVKIEYFHQILTAFLSALIFHFNFFEKDSQRLNFVTDRK